MKFMKQAYTKPDLSLSSVSAIFYRCCPCSLAIKTHCETIIQLYCTTYPFLLTPTSTIYLECQGARGIFFCPRLGRDSRTYSNIFSWDLPASLILVIQSKDRSNHKYSVHVSHSRDFLSKVNQTWAECNASCTKGVFPF